MATISREEVEKMVRQIVLETMGAKEKRMDASGICAVDVPKMKVTQEDRLDTGNDKDEVYTKDLFSLEESPRLGCGIMEMDDTTFDWQLDYDEIDVVIEGRLDICIDGRKVSAGPGEVILIPKGRKIQFSVTGHARFLYVTYPADWANQ